MIGSIIQVARDLIKSQGKNLENWQEEASTAQDSLNETEKKMQQDVKEAQEPSKEQVDTQVEEKVEEQETPENEQPKEQPEENDEEKEQKQGLILSDKNAKNLKTDKEYGEETAGKVFSIVNSVRNEIANIGKAIRGDKDTKTAGSDLYSTIKPMVKQNEEYKTNIENLDKTLRERDNSANVPSDVCLKQFFYSDDDNRSFFDSDILDAYKNLQTITFTYKPEAAEIDPTQDTETVHVGLKAQDIEAQPELASAVKEDPESGYKMVDTREMTMQNAAAISEIAKKLDEIQQKINSLT